MPIAALLMLATGLLPHDPAFLWAAVALIFLFSLAFNIGIDPYFALLADVTTPEQRGGVSGLSAIFQFAGQVLVLVAATFLWGIHPGWVLAHRGGGAGRRLSHRGGGRARRPAAPGAGAAAAGGHIEAPLDHGVPESTCATSSASSARP